MSVKLIRYYLATLLKLLSRRYCAIKLSLLRNWWQLSRAKAIKADKLLLGCAVKAVTLKLLSYTVIFLSCRRATHYWAVVELLYYYAVTLLILLILLSCYAVTRLSCRCDEVDRVVASEKVRWPSDWSCCRVFVKLLRCWAVTLLSCYVVELSLLRSW